MVPYAVLVSDVEWAAAVPGPSGGGWLAEDFRDEDHPAYLEIVSGVPYLRKLLFTHGLLFRAVLRYAHVLRISVAVYIYIYIYLTIYLGICNHRTLARVLSEKGQSKYYQYQVPGIQHQSVFESLCSTLPSEKRSRGKRDYGVLSRAARFRSTTNVFSTSEKFRPKRFLPIRPTRKMRARHVFSLRRKTGFSTAVLIRPPYVRGIALRLELRDS